MDSASASPKAHPAQKPYRAKLRFERLPAAYCHPDRIAKLLPEGLPASFRDRLQASTRLRLRLSSLLARRFALEPCTLDLLATPEGRFAQLEGEALTSALRRIGAVWHARAIRRIILAEPLRQLIERLGRDNHRAALRFIDLAPDDDGQAGNDQGDGRGDGETEGGSPDVDRLLGSIERDGLLAANAWCRHQPTALAARLRLKLPPCQEVDAEPPASHRERGLIIVDRVVTTLTPAAGTEAISPEGNGHG